jgi:2-hydroxychromene-2-carboxylate isomerase
MDAIEIKMYSDYKSPFAWLAFDPAFDLENTYRVRIRWRPFQLRIKGAGERSVYSEFKVRYSYMDARRVANARDRRIIKGPLKIFDTTPALIGGLYAERQGCLVQYSRKVFEQFFRRELAVDDVAVMAKFMSSLGLSEQGFLDYQQGEGQRDYALAQDEAAADRIFGVPLFVFKGEQFWGNDRVPMLEQRLKDAGLARSGQSR